MSENKPRNICLDALKGLAILMVALYHFGGVIAPYGYLGVDIFFTVGGYFLIYSMLIQEEKGTFGLWRYILRKTARLWPLVLVCIVVSLSIGFFLMLPDDYENLAESAVASSFFANNILQLLTVKNYWDVANIFKPLMHLWYVGVLMQAYIVIPIICKLCIVVAMEKRRGILCGVLLITVISAVLYLLPIFDDALRFYLLPFRLFEITAGGAIVFIQRESSLRNKKLALYISVVVLFIILTSRTEIFPARIMLLVCVLATMVFIYASQNMMFLHGEGMAFTVLGGLGKEATVYIFGIK